MIKELKNLEVETLNEDLTIEELQIEVYTKNDEIHVSRENEYSHIVATRYAQHGREPMFVHEVLKEFADNKNMYWDWDAGSIFLVPNPNTQEKETIKIPEIKEGEKE